MNRFLELFGHLVQFTYGVWDRIVLRGYYERLQRPENVVYFFRDVCGIPRITPKVLAARTEKYREWLTTYTKRRGVAVLRAPKGARKEEVVAPYFRRFRGNQGLVVVLTSMEQSPTFISYQPRYKPPCGDDYRRLKRAAGKQFLHYYFYVLDPVMGPMSLRVASYLPFSLNCSAIPWGEPVVADANGLPTIRAPNRPSEKPAGKRPWRLPGQVSLA
jgi:hypothetical protein